MKKLGSRARRGAPRRRRHGDPRDRGPRRPRRCRRDANKEKLKADMLTGYQEATPAGVSTNATGTFTATIDDATQTITLQADLQRPVDARDAVRTSTSATAIDRRRLRVPLRPPAGSGRKATCPPGNTSDLVTVTGTITRPT